jgi:hypothetical protein
MKMCIGWEHAVVMAGMVDTSSAPCPARKISRNSRTAQKKTRRKTAHLPPTHAKSPRSPHKFYPLPVHHCRVDCFDGTKTMPLSTPVCPPRMSSLTSRRASPSASTSPTPRWSQVWCSLLSSSTVAISCPHHCYTTLHSLPRIVVPSAIVSVDYRLAPVQHNKEI